MPDTIERTIYKLELDDAGYIKGIDSLSASTKKFSEAQTQANTTLKTNEQALKTNSERLEKARKDLENYSGTNARYRKQLENDVKSAERDQAKLTELVNSNRIAYEKATKAAQDFANTSARATNLQQTTGGRIAPPIVPVVPVIPQQLTDLPDILSASVNEFEQLRAVIAQVEARMASLNEEDEEFKLLAPIVSDAKNALSQYDEAAKKSTGSTQSLRTQLRLGREELVRLEQAGKGTSKEYFELEKRVAKLTDEFGDQQERIRVLASDTRALDFGKAAITAATAAFQTYTSISILAGDESEELQKKTMQLFAAMQLLTSLETLSNSVKRGSVLATNAQAVAQATYTAVVGASTGALRVFRLALLGTGIGAAVVAIGLLVQKYMDLKEAQEAAAAQSKIIEEINEQAIKSYASEVSKLELIKDKLTDLNIPQEKRIALAKEYNKTADEGNRIDLKQIDNIGLVNRAIDSQIAKLKERALARAAEGIIAQRAETLLLAQENARIKNLQFSIDASRTRIRIGGTKENLMDQYVEGLEQQKVLADQVAKDPKVLKAQQDLNDALNAGSKFITIDSLISPTTGAATQKKATENVFIQERDKLNERLAQLRAKEATDEAKIIAQFQESLTRELNRISDLLREEKLTTPQAKILDQKAIDINKLELDKALADFRKKILDAREKINDELRELENRNIQDQINLIQNEFDRKAALIEFNERQELENSRRNTEERIESLDLDRLLIGEQAYQEAKARIISSGELQSLNILRRFAIERQNLAADSFKNILDAYQDAIQTADLIRDEGIATQIRAVSDRFLQGRISYEKFQKEITRIQKEADAIRRDANLATQRSELQVLDDRIAKLTGVAGKEKEINDLLKERDALRRQIAAGEKADAEADAGDGQTDPRIGGIQEYAQAIGQMADAVVSFWQEANEAESKALDRSIALQEKRVSAAQRIAERGNAEYLQAEEDRLQELTLQRENAARKQLGIDAALQASQLLVGITGAIAKIASGAGAVETIASIAVIIGALATGYGLVKSLQGNQPRLAEGTTYVSRGKNPRGKDTIPAWLDEGEAVTSAKKNKEYHPVIKAIHDGTIPPEKLNGFVKNYHKIKSIPIPDYGRIKESAELSIGSDGKMAAAISEQNRLIIENNDLQRQTLRAMKNMSVSASIDRDGVAIMVNEYIQQLKIDSKL